MTVDARREKNGEFQMSRGNLSGILSVWLSWILGGISAMVGLAMIVAAFTAWGPIRESMTTISKGLHDAKAAVDLMGADFGSSSSLVSKVSASIRSTSYVVQETGTTLESIMETTGEIRNFTNEVRLSLENLPRGITSLMGGDHFSDVTVSLSRIHVTSGEALLQMEHLHATLLPVETLLLEVAEGVDSLAGDLFSTEAAFSEASVHLNSAAEAIEGAAGSSFLPLMVAFAGLIPLLVGVYLVIQGLALRRLYLDNLPSRETSS